MMMTYQYNDLEAQLRKGDLLLVVSEALGALSGIGCLDRIDCNYITIRPLPDKDRKWLNEQMELLELDDIRLTSVLWSVIIPIETIKLISVIKRYEPSNKEKETNDVRSRTTKSKNESEIQKTNTPS